MFSVCALSILRAEQLTVDLDPALTKIAYTVTDTLHTVRGTFQLMRGRLIFDVSTDAITGDVVINAASGESGSATRDKRMARDILEAQRFPEIVFKPSNVSGVFSAAAPSNVELNGSFSIHGQAHPIIIPMQVQVSQDRMTSTGRFVVPYVEWGMKNPSNFLIKVNDKVEIDVTAVGHVSGLGTP